MDPKREFPSGYVGMGNNPVSKTDPDGGGTKDWYLHKVTGEYEWHEGSEDLSLLLLKHVGGADFVPPPDQINPDYLPQFKDISFLTGGRFVKQENGAYFVPNVSPSFSMFSTQGGTVGLRATMGLGAEYGDDLAITYATIPLGGPFYRAGRIGYFAIRGSKPLVQLSSKIGRSPAGQRVFNFQARFPKYNLNVRLDRGFRAPFKNTTSNYFGKPYNGFNTHINIQKPGVFNYHIPLNPLKWKYYSVF